MLAALGLGLLSGAGSLLSGLGASSSAKSQQRRQLAYDAANRAYNESQRDLMLNQVPNRIATDAAIAGFNPVTWLQGGALGFYSNAYAMARSDQATQAVNIPSAMSAVGDAVSAGANAFGQQFRFDQSIAFQESSLNKQLQAYSARANGTRTSGMTALAMGAARSVGGGVMSSGGGKIEASTPYGLRVDPREPDQEAVATRQGDFWGEMQGTFNKFNDAYYRATGGLTLRNLESDAWKWANRNLDVLADKFPKHPGVFDFHGAMKKAPSQWNSPFRNPNTPWATGGAF